LSGNTLTFTAPKANKIQVKEIRALLAHVRNLVRGLDKKFVYQLEACNVHFPMTLKVEGKRLAINNFLGEKTPRYARIEENVDVEVKGTRVTVSSHDIESAGRTVSLIERATHVRNRDRRVFQDGIFLVERPGRAA
jgi:large subunit ribosomal protein L6